MVKILFVEDSLNNILSDTRNVSVITVSRRASEFDPENCGRILRAVSQSPASHAADKPGHGAFHRPSPPLGKNLLQLTGPRSQCFSTRLGSSIFIRHHIETCDRYVLIFCFRCKLLHFGEYVPTACKQMQGKNYAQ